MPLLGNRTLITAVLAVLATALVLGAVVLLVRRDDNSAIQVELPTADPSEMTSGVQGVPPSGSAAAETELKVYVSGAVHYPGVYTLRQHDRLSDAVKAAGGARADAELAAVNLARRVQDEEHYHIPRVGETPPPSDSLATLNARRTDSTATSVDSGLINLNVASVNLLETLPGIGQALATAIVAFREEHGPFESVEEITSVPRIGPATYEKIRDLVTVSDGR